MSELEFIKSFLLENAPYVKEKHADKGRLTVTTKANASDLLTEVDLTVQKRAVERIADLFPGDGVMAEEGEYATTPANPNDRCWVLDPVDGTSNFVRGMFPIFAISLGFCVGGVPVAGGVILPVTGDIFLAGRGGGAWRNGERMHVSDLRNVEASRVEMDFGWLGDRPMMLSRAPGIICAIGQVRCLGSAVCSLCEVANGGFDGFVHMTLNPWDFAAGQILIEEAGGRATRLDGSPLRLFDGQQGVLATNGGIHEELLQLLRKA